MTGYRLSKKADLDFAESYEFTILNWGEAHADEYFTAMIGMFEMLAENNHMGTHHPEVRDGLYKMPWRSHSIYYEIEDNIVVIKRLFRAGADPARHL